MASSSNASADTCLPCNALYDPNPDIAGKAIFISFLVHTCIFIFLSMILTPIISLYLQGLGSQTGQPEEMEEMEVISRLDPLRQRDHQEEPERAPRYMYKSKCREVIRDTYTSQYVSGLAFIVTAFVKRNEISPYHLRVIYSIVSMHSTLGLIANYDRFSVLTFLGYWVFDRYNRLKNNPRRHMPMKWGEFKFQMIDFAFLLNLGLFIAFSIFTPIQSQNCFKQCYNHDLAIVLGSLAMFNYLLFWSSYGGGKRTPLGWLTFTIGIGGFVGFQNWQYHHLTTIFRPTTLPAGMTSEITFSFGQILVLFMIFPLVAEYFGALIGDLSKIRQHTIEEAQPITTFLKLFSILLPWFLHRIYQDYIRTINQSVQTMLDRNAARISQLGSRIREQFNSFKTRMWTLKSRLQPKKRTNTTILELGDKEPSQDTSPTSTPPQNSSTNLAPRIEITEEPEKLEPTYQPKTKTQTTTGDTSPTSPRTEPSPE